MDILTETKHLQNRLDDLRNSQMSIGLVPTMGYLHDGHLSLIRKARSENDAVVTTRESTPIRRNRRLGYLSDRHREGHFSC